MTIELVAGTDVTDPKPSNVVPMVKPKPAPNPRKKPTVKKLTPKALYLRDVSAMGEITDHLHAAGQAMSVRELRAFRARIKLVLENLQKLKEDTEDFVIVEDDTDGN